MKKILLATSATFRLITLLSLCLWLFAFPAAAIASPVVAVAAPTQITFTILNTCSSGDTYNFFLNGTSIGSTAGNTGNSCACDAALQTFTVNNAALLTGAWDPSGSNSLRVTKSGTSTYFAWVSAQLNFTTGSSRAYYDYNGGDATQTNLCSAEYSGAAFDELLVTSTILYRDADGDGFGDPNNVITDYSPTPGTPPIGYVTIGGDCDDANPTVPSQTPCQAKPFNKTAPGLGFTQELVASLPDGNPTSGYGFDSHGNPYTFSFNGNLYKIDLSTTNPAPGGVGTIHPLVNLGPIIYRTGSRSGQNIGTVYNFTQYPDGTVYANSNLGVVQVNLETATATSEPLPGSAWGIIVDPQLNAHGHHNIITAGGRVVDPVDHRDLGSCGISGDGIAIDATGNFIFAASGFQIYKRTSAPGSDLPVFTRIGNYGGSPDGMAFGVVGTDQVVVSNDGGAKTVTMWKFPDNDFTKVPTPTIIASQPTSSEYGDQANVGPDGYFYITYWYGTRFPDGSTNGNTSVVRFGPAGRFLPPTHSDNLSLTPATDTKTVGTSIVLTATQVSTDLSTNQTVPVANTSVTFKVVGGPDAGQTFTGTTDVNGRASFTLVNQNGPGDDVVHAQFVDGNNNTQTSNNSVITFVKPVCTAPAFTNCPGNQTVNTSSNSCDNTVTYSSPESVTGSPSPTITYAFTGATSGSGTGNGSGSLFNKGTTTVTLTATNSCGTATCTFTVTVTDNQPPVLTTNGDQNVNAEEGKCGASVSVSANATDNCSVGAPTGVRSDGLSLSDPYPVGSTTITWNVTDANGNPAAPVTQTVTVTDNEKPTITAPANISVNNDAGQCGATISIGTPTTGDNCGVQTVSNDHSSTTYPVGTTTVTWTVTDIHGNSSSSTQTITVTDNELPVITSNGDKSVINDAGKCGAIVFVSATAKDNCGVGAPGGVRSDGLALTDPYAVGTTTITWTVTDIHTNNAIPVTQTIVVTDNEKPIITVPADQVFCANADGSLNYTIPVSSATDNCGVATVSYAVSGATTRTGSGYDASGSFNIGTSTITWTVTDIHGNVSSSSSSVVVNPLPVASFVSTDANQFCNQFTLTGSSTINPAGYSWSSTHAAGSFSTSPQLSLGQTNGDGNYYLYVQATNTGCVSASSVVYNFQKQNLVSSYTILAFDEVKLGMNNTVASGSVGVMAQKGEAEFKSNTTVSSPGSFVKAKKIDIDGKGVVISTPIYAAATGITLPTMYYNTATTQRLSNMSVRENTTSTLSGNYGNLTLKKGSVTTLTGTVFGSIKVEQGAQVTFTAPVVSIDKLDVSKGPRNGYSYVRFSQDTKVLVSKSVSIGSQVYVNPDNYKVTFYVGSQKVEKDKGRGEDHDRDEEHRNDDGSFSVHGGDTKVTANIYMPDGKLKVTGGYAYGDYGKGRGDCDRDDEDDKDYGKGNSYVYMTGLFISEEVDGDGKNVIWNTFTCGAAPVAVSSTTKAVTQTVSKETAMETPTEEELKVTVMPNPSTTYFTLKLESKYSTPVNMRVMDASGRVVDAKSKIGSNSTIQIGQNYISGTYFAEMIQGTKRKVVQLIKGRG